VNNEPPPLASQSKHTVGQVAEGMARNQEASEQHPECLQDLPEDILPEFVSAQLGALTPSRIERFLNTRKKKALDEPLSAKSAQQMRAIMQSLATARLLHAIFTLCKARE
jgi:hypothetical protein